MIGVYATGGETHILDCGSVGRRRIIDCVPKGAIEGTMLIPIGQSVAKRCTGYRRLDRKSTRLNSSHLVISYAVFCLKKKKKTTIRGAVLQQTQRGRWRVRLV